MVLVYYYVENDMDLFNNQVGRDIAIQGSSNLLQDILKAINNGEFTFF